MSAGAILLGCTTLTLAELMVAQQPDALTVAARSLGASSIRTLRFSGSGATFTVGQNVAPADLWPRVTMKSFTGGALRVAITAHRAAPGRRLG
jgi:hypothetical protein